MSVKNPKRCVCVCVCMCVCVRESERLKERKRERERRETNGLEKTVGNVDGEPWSN